MKKKLIKGGAFLAIFVCLNNMMSWLFVPADGASNRMWENYKQMEQLDANYIGASVCQSTFNPVVIDEILETNSYNMGTPSQPIDLSYVAVKTALEEHAIKRVIMGFGYFALSTQNSQQAEAAFIQAKNKQGTFLEVVVSNGRYLYQNKGKSISLNFLLPWVNNHVQFNIVSLKDNVKKKLAEKNKDAKELSVYEKRGMLLYTDVIDYDNLGDANSWNWYQPEFSKDAVSKMRQICELCKDNGVELVIVNTPRPSFDITTYAGDYYGQYLWLKDFFEEYNAAYYDFNFAKPELFESKPEYFYNFEHLNVTGANAFSKDFARFLEMRDQGEDVDNLFYEWDAYLAAVHDNS